MSTDQVIVTVVGVALIVAVAWFFRLFEKGPKKAHEHQH
jgi:hypothetical protein